MAEGQNAKHILSIDVGTTSVKGAIYNIDNLKCLSLASKRITPHEPQPGWNEIVPEHLWNAVLEASQDAISQSKVAVSSIECLGLCVQRNTFVTWDSQDGQPFHNFITWKDQRSQSLCAEWNNSRTFRALKAVARGLCALTGGAAQWKTLANFSFTPAITAMRLRWVLNNVEALHHAVRRGRARFGSIESWLVWRLTGRRTWAAETSCMYLTGLVSPQRPLDYNYPFLRLLRIPVSMLPPIYDSVSSKYGETDKSIFGVPIRFACVVADQSASAVGDCCFRKKSAKVSLGTVGSLTVVDKNKPAAVTSSCFPVVIFKQRSSLFFGVEAYLPKNAYVSNIVDMLLTDGFLDDVSLLDGVATSVTDTAGVVFRLTQDHGKFGYRIEGETKETKAAHVVRAALIAIANNIKEASSCLENEQGISVLGNTAKDGSTLPPVRINGGVSRSDFVCQAIANAVGRNVERHNDVQASARGTAMLAGFGATIYPSLAHLEKLVFDQASTDRVKLFTPQKDCS